MGRIERYTDDVRAIRAVGVSADRWITVTREGSGEIDVRVRPGMLRMCGADHVAREIRSALIAAVADHRQQFRQLRIEYFGSALGAEPFTPADPDPISTRRHQV